MIINKPKPCHQDALRQLWQEAFLDDDSFLDGFFSVGFSPDRCLCLWQDTCLASALYWFDCNWAGQKVAYLYAVATAASQQGKGYCRALMEKTHGLLKEQGYKGAILVPGSESLFRFYEKLGYKACCKLSLQEVSDDDTAAALRQITATEYSKLQKVYLPGDAVFHNTQTLAFAATFAKFYQGDGFAFCGGKDDDTFYFQEFMGDEGSLPGILTTLKTEKGVYRRAGTTPFAMYFSLDGDDTLPDHFDIPLN